MSENKVIINGIELELNLFDADIMEKYERLNEEIKDRISDPKAYEGKTTAEGMRFQCRCVEDYFDGLFGVGTSAKVFPKNNDLRIRMDAFGQATALAGTINGQIGELVNKYSPQRVQNRAERRAGKNKKKFHAVNKN